MSTSRFTGGLIAAIACLLAGCGGAVEAGDDTSSGRFDSGSYPTTPEAAGSTSAANELAIEPRVTRTMQPAACSPEFIACRTNKAASTLCISGNCSCLPPIHPGENTPVSCYTGEPDMGLL